MSEATKLNKSIIAGVQKKSVPPISMENKDPHIEVESQIINRIGYTYQLWKIKTMGGKSKRICVRCAIHSYNAASQEYMNLYALHEWNTKRQMWSKDLDT